MSWSDDLTLREAETAGHPTFGLTQQQYYALLVIQELIALAGVAPSYREIQHELGFASRSQVHWLVTCLCQRGYLTRLPGQTRSLVVCHPIPMPADPEIEMLWHPGDPIPERSAAR